MSSIKQVIPDKHAVMVEYPGYVRNTEAALDTLGGTQAVTKAATDINSFLQLRFRPGDPLSHPVYGDRRPTKGLLLRIARKAGESDGEVKGEVVAHVDATFRFNGMADFQYVSAGSQANPGKGEAGEEQGPLGLAPEPLLCVPPLFTKLDLPLDYAYRSYYADMASANKAPGGPKGKSHLSAHVIKFNALNVPGPEDNSTNDGNLRSERKELLKQLQLLFTERPIWSLNGLSDQLPGHMAHEIEALLPRLAYMFRSGPFKSLWIRQGYDPRSQPSSRRYQAITYELPASWHSKLSARQEAEAAGDVADSSLPPVAKTAADLCRFEGMPDTPTTILQPCDLHDHQIAELLKQDQPSLNSSCTPESGWFPAADWEWLHKHVASRFQTLLASHAPADAEAKSPPLESQLPSDQVAQPVVMEVDTAVDPAAAHATTDASADAPVQPSVTHEAGSTSEAPAMANAFSSLTIQGDRGAVQAGNAGEGNNIVPEGMLQDLLADWPDPLSETRGHLQEAPAAPDDGDDEFEIFEDDSENEGGEGNEYQDGADEEDDEDG